MADKTDEVTKPEKKSGMDKGTLTMIISSIVGGVLMALQGVTLHQADNVQQETVRVGAETSAELKAILKLQESSNAELAAWSELRERIETAMTAQTKILGLNKTTDDKQIQLMQIAQNSLDRQERLVKITESNEEKITQLLNVMVKPSPAPTPSQ
jgi:hypothetical protein